MYDLDPSVLRRQAERPPLRTPRFGARDLREELAISLSAARRSVADPSDHQAVFELLHQAPVGDVIRLAHPRLPILRDPRFLALWETRSLPALDTVGAAALRSLPEGSLGRAYADYVAAGGLRDDYLDLLPAPDDPVAYLAVRTVLLHDLIHLLTGYVPGEPLDELRVEAFLLAQTGAFNHVLFLGGFGLHFLKGDPRRLASTPVAVVEAFRRGGRAENLLLVPWQRHLERPLDAVRAEMRL